MYIIVNPMYILPVCKNVASVWQIQVSLSWNVLEFFFPWIFSIHSWLNLQMWSPCIWRSTVFFFHVSYLFNYSSMWRNPLTKQNHSGICNWPFVCSGAPLLLCEFGGWVFYTISIVFGTKYSRQSPRWLYDYCFCWDIQA